MSMTRERDSVVYERLIGAATDHLLSSALAAINAYKARTGEQITAHKTPYHSLDCAKLRYPAGYCTLAVDREAHRVTFTTRFVSDRDHAVDGPARTASIVVSGDGTQLQYVGEGSQSAEELLKTWLPLYFDKL